MVEILNTIRLLFGLVGVAIIFRWRPPLPSFERGISLGIVGPQVAEHDAKQSAKEVRYRRRSQLGFTLILLGFAIQILAVW